MAVRASTDVPLSGRGVEEEEEGYCTSCLGFSKWRLLEITVKYNVLRMPPSNKLMHVSMEQYARVCSKM
jgi:hypothetical protein